MIPHRTFREGTRIPHRFIRCVPADTDPQVDAWWAQFGDLHPGWDLRTVVDPIDPMDWPALGRFHHLATSGAQLAGFVRLEAVHRWGGWYVDSDVEPLRSFAGVSDTTHVVIGTEDGIHLTDAVFGAPPRHPAIRAVMDHVAALYADAFAAGSGRLPNAQVTGPLATTHVLAGRDDVTVLDREVFYPYSYTEPHRRGEDFTVNPATLAVHHWAFSWEGT